MNNNQEFLQGRAIDLGMPRSEAIMRTDKSLIRWIEEHERKQYISNTNVNQPMQQFQSQQQQLSTEIWQSIIDRFEKRETQIINGEISQLMIKQVKLMDNLRTIHMIQQENSKPNILPSNILDEDEIVLFSNLSSSTNKTSSDVRQYMSILHNCIIELEQLIQARNDIFVKSKGNLTIPIPVENQWIMKQRLLTELYQSCCEKYKYVYSIRSLSP